MVSEARVTDPQQLQRLLGGPELGWLVDRIRIRLERGEPVDGTVTLVGATAEQRRAAARLRAAVETLSGPVRDRAAERATAGRRFQDVIDAARHSRLATQPWHVSWL